MERNTKEKYYLLEADDAIAKLDSSKNGLSEVEAQKRLNDFGKNELREKESDPTWKIFLESFKDPMVIILIGAAILQIVTGSVMESLIIFVVLILNAVLGTVQTKKGGVINKQFKADVSSICQSY